MHDDNEVLSQLKELRSFGVGVSVDGVGTGFASLAVLRDFPATSIQIDRRFTQAMLESDADRAIMVSIIGLARELGLGVVAEGIETNETLEFLDLLKCDKGKGYYFGKLMPQMFSVTITYPNLPSTLQIGRTAKAQSPSICSLTHLGWHPDKKNCHVANC